MSGHSLKLTPLHRKAILPWPGADWRCTHCGALLGRIRDRELHVRFGRRHEYVTALPASCTCVGCGSLNRVKAAEPR